MEREETAALLRECQSGAKMGISALEDVLSKTRSRRLERILEQSRGEHEQLRDEVENLLFVMGEEGKNPNPLVQGMSKLVTGARMVVHPSDSTIADLVTDGCSTGVKSLRKHLNNYDRAGEKAKRVTQRLIDAEEKLMGQLERYL